MDSHCVWCYAPLGQNETIEHFPVGRRLAFDASKGWLWAVCRQCERWSLAPIEERWEAIEECERLFRDTRLRVSTDEIGLARVGDGLDLIRIGSPHRPEFALWRYGDQFGRRRRRYLLTAGAMVAGAGALALGPVVGLIAIGGAMQAGNLSLQAWNFYNGKRTRVRLRLPGREKPVYVRQPDLNGAQILRDKDGWALHMSYHERSVMQHAFMRVGRKGLPENPEKFVDLHGDDALKAVAKLLPAINARGGQRTTVKSAVKLLAETPDPHALFHRFSSGVKLGWIDAVTERARPLAGQYFIGSEMTESERAEWRNENNRLLRRLRPEVRLALEMASHEEVERRAMLGELAILKVFWREATEIAEEADRMLESASDQERLEQLKSGP